ncbi:MAG: hypothetical protein KDA79_11640 [Planctomycetaceae bacterium]|nr:hypothetical protein [Planctomycetaceae bacterium]
MLQWLKHAFAVEPPGPAVPAEGRQRELLEKLCREVVRRRMTVPAQFALETCRPLRFAGSQALLFFSPLVSAVSDSSAPADLAAFLERRGSIDWICQRLDQLEQEAKEKMQEDKEPAASLDGTGGVPSDSDHTGMTAPPGNSREQGTE